MLQKKKTPPIQGPFPVFPFLCLVDYELGSRVGSRRKSPAPSLPAQGQVRRQRLVDMKSTTCF